MKVLYTPAIPTQTCNCCGAKVSLKLKDLKDDGWSMTRTAWYCPICKGKNIVKFKKQDETSYRFEDIHTMLLDSIQPNK